MKKISRKDLRRLIEQQYKGVPAEFPPDHKKKMGNRMRSNSEMMDLLRKGDMGFGERGMKYDPVMGDEGRPIGVSQRGRTDQEMKSVRAAADAERAAAESERVARQQAMEKEEARLSGLSLEELSHERSAFLNELEKVDQNTSYPYGRNRGDVRSYTVYRKKDGQAFTSDELQRLKDYDALEARQHGSYAALAGVTSSSLSPDGMTLTVKYYKHTAG